MKRIWNLSLILLFLLIFFLSLRKIMDLDIGFHLRGEFGIGIDERIHPIGASRFILKNNLKISCFYRRKA